MSELKVVISLKGDKASVGIQAPDCDPVFFADKGDLKTVLDAVPGFVEEAKARWEKNRLNPKCEAPLPSQTQATATTSRDSAPRPQKQASKTPSMF